jgi:hypothetical protein
MGEKCRGFASEWADGLTQMPLRQSVATMDWRTTGTLID